MTIEKFVPTLRRLAGDFWNGSRIRRLFYSTTTKVSLECKITRRKVNEPRADAMRRILGRILILKKFPQSSRTRLAARFPPPWTNCREKVSARPRKRGFHMMAPLSEQLVSLWRIIRCTPWFFFAVFKEPLLTNFLFWAHTWIEHITSWKVVGKNDRSVSV